MSVLQDNCNVFLEYKLLL